MFLGSFPIVIRFVHLIAYLDHEIVVLKFFVDDLYTTRHNKNFQPTCLDVFDKNWNALLISGLIGLIGGLIGLIGGKIGLMGGLVGPIGGLIGLIGGLISLISDLICIISGLISGLIGLIGLISDWFKRWSNCSNWLWNLSNWSILFLNSIYFQAIQTADFYQKKHIKKTVGLIFSYF